VTGRPLTGVPAEVLGIPGIRYVITSNGANTYALGGGAGDDRNAGGGQRAGDGKKTEYRLKAGDGKKAGGGPETGLYETDRKGAVGPDGIDWEELRVLRKVHMPHKAVRRVLEAAPGDDVIREIFVRGIGYHDERTQRMLEARFEIAPPILSYINRSRRIVTDFETLLSDESSHVENISLMFTSQEARDEAFARIRKIRRRDGGRLLHVLLPWRTDLEITHADADKWEALRDLADHLGVSADEVMTIGDGDNDRPMLRGAGLSFAMGNAPERIKVAADFVTGDNESEGVARFLEKYFNERDGVLWL
jgi:hydroxymethylpyrimidine pyrophosphatase-like HAD family hydrolase